jgi:hypothetical protein
LKEKFMKAAAIDTQMSKETSSNFEKATAHLKSVRDLHITDFAEKARNATSRISDWSPGSAKAVAVVPETSVRRRAAAPEAFNSTAIAIRSCHSVSSI